ncbi:MAG: M50 family metallopeptidase [Longimicrobiaceae bacterium]
MEGLTASRLFEGRGATSSTWILGSPEHDRYLTVPEAALEPVRRATALMDGTRTAEEIRGRVRDELRRDLNVEDLAGRLRGAGLLLGPDGEVPTPRSHIDRMSLTLFSLPTARLADVVRRHAPWAGGVWFLGLLAAAALSAGVLAGVPEPANPWLRYPPPAAVVAGILASVLLHELSHGLAAVREGLSPRALTGGLYLGCLPIVYLRIPGIYTLAPTARIRVWSAGCVLNGVLAVAFLAFARLLPPGSAAGSWWHAMALWNLAVLQLNLLPFLPTDGYFLLSTLLREHNLRSRAWTTLFQWLRGSGPVGRRVRLGMGMYIVGVVAMLCYTLYQAGDWFRTLAAGWGPFRGLGLPGPIPLVVFTLLWRRLFVARRSSAGPAANAFAVATVSRVGRPAEARTEPHFHQRTTGCPRRPQ